MIDIYLFAAFVTSCVKVWGSKEKNHEGNFFVTETTIIISSCCTKIQNPSPQTAINNFTRHWLLMMVLVSTKNFVNTHMFSIEYFSISNSYKLLWRHLISTSFVITLHRTVINRSNNKYTDRDFINLTKSIYKQAKLLMSCKIYDWASNKTIILDLQI